MPKQQTCQIFIYKINSQRLAEAKWNLTLPLEEARRNEEIVPLASSQQLRWIDALNNMVNQEAKAKAVKRRIKDLRHEENSPENRREIRQLYQQLDKIQFKPDYVTVVIHNKRDYRRARKGFYINGVRYERLLGTTGGVKNNTIVFVSSRLVNELRKRINNGRNPDQEFIPAKLEAYRALTCSASIPVTEPDGILVVNDCLTHFKDDVILIDDSNDGEPEMTHIKDYDCELNASDGFGLMSYELAQQWSEDLQLEKTMSGCCIRNAFCKGMVFPFPFREFAKKVAKKNMVLDAWGTWRDIHRVQLVLTTSMLKLWDSYDSLEDYMDNCHENGYTFAVTKTCELELENSEGNAGGVGSHCHMTFGEGPWDGKGWHEISNRRGSFEINNPLPLHKICWMRLECKVLDTGGYTWVRISKTIKLPNSEGGNSNNNAGSTNNSNSTAYFPAYTGTSNSIITALNAIGVNSSYSYREKIAQANGITGYRGTAQQNLNMVALLKKGLLVKPGSAVYFPAYTGNSGSIAAALNSLGIDSSYSYREKIAAKNGITGYKGTPAQNTRMLNLLKQGKLLKP